MKGSGDEVKLDNLPNVPFTVTQTPDLHSWIEGGGDKRGSGTRPKVFYNSPHHAHLGKETVRQGRRFRVASMV